MENGDVRETSQIIYHSKGRDDSYPKMYVLSNLSNFVKNHGHLSEILAFLPQAHQIWLSHVTPGAALKICNFLIIWHQILGEVIKFRVCSFITSKVITWQGPYGSCQVKRYSLRSQQFCQHILCVEQSEGAFVWMFCALVCVALCVIAKYKTTLYKFNWLKDKLPCLDSLASSADRAAYTYVNLHYCRPMKKCTWYHYLQRCT